MSTMHVLSVIGMMIVAATFGISGMTQNASAVAPGYTQCSPVNTAVSWTPFGFSSSSFRFVQGIDVGDIDLGDIDNSIDDLVDDLTGEVGGTGPSVSDCHLQAEAGKVICNANPDKSSSQCEREAELEERLCIIGSDPI